MDFIKPNREKIRLFIIIILASLIAAVPFIFLSRFLAVNYYVWNHPLHYRLGYLVANILRYTLIGYLIIAFYKKKLSPTGEYYSIFKAAMLLWVFGFLHRSVIGYFSRNAPEIFFSKWMNIEFFAVGLLWYYVLACIIYYFGKKYKPLNE